MRAGTGFAAVAGLMASGMASAAETSRVIEEIIVTAERREAAVQDTPIAITAYSNEMLDLRGIDSVQDLQFSAPNLVVSHNSQSPVTYAYIRGIGSDQLVAGFDPGVAYNVDGVYVGQPSSMPGDMWDMERVEVLRGPQGTLYGRNTTGGSINVISHQPVAGFEAFGDLTGGNHGRQRVRAVLNAGTERIAGRLSYLNDSNDGFQENLIGSDGDKIDHESIRGKLRFGFGDSGDLVLTAQRFENRGPQSQKRLEPYAPVELAPGFVIDVYEGALPNPADPREAAKDHRERLELDNDLLSAQLSWDFPGFTLVSITGRIENDWFQSTDNDQSSNPVQFQQWTMETEQFTQELRLVSTGTGPWEWIVGYFHFDEELTTDYLFRDSSVAGFTFMNGGDLETESNAVFGQVSYDLRDGGLPLRVTGGLRWTRDEKDVDEYQQIPEFAVDMSGAMSEQWEEYSGKLGLDWFVGDDLMAYVNVARGYKGGGFSIGVFDAFDPETVNSIELGLKSRFWGQRAQLNAAAFYNDYQDLQVNFLEFTTFTTDNAAEATIRGVELEGTLIPAPNLTLSAMATWLDAEFDRYQFTPEIDLSGDTLNRAPEYTAALSAQYDWPLGDLGTLTARADYYWQDDVYYIVQNVPRHRADAFSTTDVRLMWTSRDDRWEIDAFARNITDEDNVRGIAVNEGQSIGDTTDVSYFPPRTYGVRVGWRMGR